MLKVYKYASVFLVTFLMIFFSEISLAAVEGFAPSLNLLYLTRKVEAAGGTSVETKNTYLDLTLNYITSSQWIVGAQYTMDTYDTITTATNTEKITAFGPNVGYMWNTWSLEGTYFLQAEDIPATSSSAKWNKGSGYQLNVNYFFNMSAGGFVGLQLAYRFLDFKNYYNGSTDVDLELKQTEIIPKIKLGYAF